MMVLYIYIYSCSLRSPLASLAPLERVPRSKVGGVILKTLEHGFFGPPKNSLREFLLTPSTMSKRSFGATGGYNKSTRMVGGRKLTYRPSAPVAGSYRSRVSLQAAQRYAKPEVKGLDTTFTAAIVSTTNDGSNIVPLNLIPPGSGSFNRIGRKARLLSARIRGAISFVTTPGSTGIVNGNYVRMLVVWDKQPSGALPSWNTIFGLTPQTGTETTSLLAPLAYDNMERFSVLKDVMLQPQDLLPVGVSATGVTTQIVPFDTFISLKNCETTYSGQSATQTISDISSGALYLVFRALANVAYSGGTPTVPGNQASIEANSFARLRFIDA